MLTLTELILERFFLTFFFRYMKPLIEKGYLYIAQPPLYKAKIGKKEEYLKDERSFKKFLLDWARDHAMYLSIDGVDVEKKRGRKGASKLSWYIILALKKLLRNLSSPMKNTVELIGLL